jgi:hypothetical protein|tara:strand:- start:202 stop:408 length:207 start_codon:yes stop_codon:yes gene_type:complete
MKESITQLFDLLAKDLVRRIASGEATSADLSVARQFLKDNGIDASLEQSDPLLNLVKTLPFDDLEDVA